MSQPAKDFVEWFYRLVVVTALGAGAWFSKLVWAGQQELADAITALRISDAKVSESRFTATDWTKASTEINAKFNDTDKRVTRLEDSAVVAKEALARIEAKLGTRP